MAKIQTNMILVFFINGLAFFTMGLAIIFETRRPSKLKLAESLWLLAVFALLRSLANWIEMLLLIQGQAPPVSGNLPLQTAKVLLLPLSCMFLLQFGINSIIAADKRCIWLRWASPVLISLWLLTLIWTIHSSSAASAEWLPAADVWARYALYLPGSAFSGFAAFLHSRVLREMKLSHIARDCIGVAVAFSLKGIIAGLVVSPAPYSPAMLKEGSFLAAVGMPAQGFRMITTLAITYFVVRALEVFEIEQRQQLEMTTQQRLQAQQETLETQRQTREEIERWSKQWQDVVNEIAMAISQPLELREMLDIALRKVLALTGLEAGEMFLMDEQAQELMLITHHGLSRRAIQGVERMKFSKGLTERAARSGEPIVKNISEDSRLTKTVAKEEEFQSYASVPLKSKGKVLGIMNLASKSHHPFTPQEVALLTAIGQQIGVAIENAGPCEQVRSIAVLEERDRLGRELHDGLAQALGYLHLKSKAVERLLASGQMAQAQTELHEMQEVAREAYEDVRESILGLRTTISPGVGLIPTLTEYLHKFSQQSGISARLVIGDDVKIEFAPVVEIHLLRIIQEALTNVRKHSQASRAWVRFEADGKRAVITVEDDGRGFDPSCIGQAGQQHFGLQTMRERAESVGGVFHISTQSGQGTRVIVQLPLSHGGGR